MGHPPDNALPLYFGHFQFNKTMDEVCSDCYLQKKKMLWKKIDEDVYMCACIYKMCIF